MTCIEARGLRKTFGTDDRAGRRQFAGGRGPHSRLIGPNGAGKTTALNAILGLTPYQGELRVLGRDPWNERDQLMRDVCFIAGFNVGDYTQGLGQINADGQRRMVLYIGSSIGNFEPDDAVQLLRDIRKELKPGEKLLLGVDMVKDREILSECL